MADKADCCKKQRAVIEFLVSEGEKAASIHKRLQGVYGDYTLDVSNVRRWCKRIKDGEEEEGQADLKDQMRIGRPAQAVCEQNLEKVDQLIQSNRRITINEISDMVGVSRGSVGTMINELGYSKVCAKWVPRQLTDDMKRQRVEASTELLELHDQGGPSFLKRIVTGDETWVHHYEPESKRRSMEWRHSDSPRKKKFKSQASAGKVMATVFWDQEGVILVDFMPKGTTINSEAYILTLTKLKIRLRRCRPHLSESNVLLQHDNARPHTSFRTREQISKWGWTTLPHPAYSPDLAPSDYHLFGPMKEALRGQRFSDDGEVISAVRQWLRSQPKSFYEAGIQALIKRWKAILDNCGDYIEG